MQHRFTEVPRLELTLLTAPGIHYHLIFIHDLYQSSTPIQPVQCNIAHTLLNFTEFESADRLFFVVRKLVWCVKFFATPFTEAKLEASPL